MQKLINLLRYLVNMRVTENEVIPVVDDTHGTERLKSADGRQVVISYPSLRQTGETSNSYQDQLPAAIFVLEKAMAGQRTDKDELEQYLSMLATVDMILKTLRADTLGQNACPRLAGMTIKVANTVPVYKVFGSWAEKVRAEASSQGMIQRRLFDFLEQMSNVEDLRGKYF